MILMLPENVTSSDKEFIFRGMSLTYIISKKGPRIHACGIPHFFNVPPIREKNFGLHKVTLFHHSVS